MDVILQVFAIFVAATLAAELFARLNLPAVAGELLAGVLLGPHLAGVIELSETTTVLAELGLVVLLFTVGLETPISGLLRVGRAALVTSLVGILVSAAGGALVVWAFGNPLDQAVLAGFALGATSVGVAARVFHDLGLVSSGPARVVLGAAVVDDVVILALFPLVQGVAGRDGGTAGILVGLAGGIGFITLVGILGSRLARRHSGFLELPRVRRAPFVLSLVLCLGLAALAERVGLAALVGAFLAGMVLAETRDRYELDRRMLPLFDFLVPFFFVVAGAQIDAGLLIKSSLGFAVVLSVVTVAAKLGGCAAGAIGMGGRQRLQIGAGMVPRNEVTLVVASAGVASGALGQELFAVLVGAVLVSTILAAPLLRLAIPGPTPYRERPREGGA